MNKFKLDITGLFGRTDFSLEMDRPIKFLTGLNGSGKSTVLKLLYAIYHRDSDFVAGVPFELLSYTDDNYHVSIAKKTPDETISLSLPKKRPMFRYIYMPDCGDYVSTRIFAPFKGETPDMTDRRHIIPYNSLMAQRPLNPKKSDSRSKTFSLFRRLWDDNHAYLKLPDIGTKFPGNFISKQTRKPVHYEKLSNGEKRWYMLLYTLVFLVGKGDVLLLDSPEHFLHISWHKKIINIMRGIMRSKPFHCLIVTNSPFIIEENWEDSVDIGVQEGILGSANQRDD